MKNGFNPYSVALSLKAVQLNGAKALLHYCQTNRFEGLSGKFRIFRRIAFHIRKWGQMITIERDYFAYLDEMNVVTMIVPYVFEQVKKAPFL